jgi:WD40 repeat protein
VDRLRAEGEKKVSAVPGVAFSPDGKHLATVHDDGCLALWDAHDLRLLVTTRAHGPGVAQSVTFARDGAELACACKDGSVTFWDVRRLLRAASREK